MYTLNTRDMLDSLIDGHPDDGLGAMLSEVLTIAGITPFQLFERLRRALSFMEECAETAGDHQDLRTLRSYAVKFIEGQIAIFVTSDGYELYYQSKPLEGCRDDCDLGPSEPAEGVWVDSLVPELQDNFWYGDMLGPWDTDTKERLEGRLES